jgi:hypothetical protein
VGPGLLTRLGTGKAPRFCEVSTRAIELRSTERVKDPSPHELKCASARVNIELSVKFNCAFFLLVTFSADQGEPLSKIASHP